MKEVFILGFCRIFIKKMVGSLDNVPAVELGFIVIKEAVKRAGINSEDVDHVFMRCVIQAGVGQMSLDMHQLKLDYLYQLRQKQLMLFVALDLI